MQPVRLGPTTGQTGPLRIGHQSRPVRPVGQTGQTGPTQSGTSNTFEHYRARTNDMCETIKESEDMDKLGQGFMLADPLEKSRSW